MGLTSDHIPVEEMLRSSSLWLEKLPKASNANEEMMIFASYLINILAKMPTRLTGTKLRSITVTPTRGFATVKMVKAKNGLRRRIFWIETCWHRHIILAHYDEVRASHT